ncbi:MAG: NAD(P)/FAD-dependent oxidoreductase [Sporichthyaceae bacterium]
MGVERVDVVVVGARCAGSAVAVPLARAGRRVLVLEKVSFPADTLSTHVLVPNGVVELMKMGALDAMLALGPARVPYFRVRDDDFELREQFRSFAGIDYGLCVPRDQQDQVLAAAARAAGAEVRERCKVTMVVWRAGRAAGVRYVSGGVEYEVHAKLVVGADGRWSRVAAEVDAWQPYRGSLNGRGFAFRYMDDPMAGTERHREFAIYRAHGTMGLTLPTCPEGRVVAVWMCPAGDIAEFRGDAEAAWKRKLDGDPDGMKARLIGATNQSTIRRTDDLSSFYRRSSGPGWALVGDAGHFKIPSQVKACAMLYGMAVCWVRPSPRCSTMRMRSIKRYGGGSVDGTRTPCRPITGATGRPGRCLPRHWFEASWALSLEKGGPICRTPSTERARSRPS